MTFQECCAECLNSKDLVREFNRLTGLQLGQYRTPINSAIDKACGYDPDAEAIPKFVEFVYRCVWLPLCVQQEKPNAKETD